MPDLLPYAANKLMELQDRFRVPEQRISPPCPSMAEYDDYLKYTAAQEALEALHTLRDRADELEIAVPDALKDLEEALIEEVKREE